MKKLIAASAIAMLAATGAFAQGAGTAGGAGANSGSGLGFGGLGKEGVAAGVLGAAIVIGVITNDDNANDTTVTPVTPGT